MSHAEKLNLIPAIREVENHIKNTVAEYTAHLKPYYDSLDALRKINQVCEHCEGTGWVLRSRSCAEDDRPDPDNPANRVTCQCCHGTGLSNYGEDKSE